MRVVLGLLACLLAAPASALTIDWVPIGDPGNASDGPPDPRPPGVPNYSGGAVPYEYSISKFEITNEQYAEFLNAKAAAADPFGLFNRNMEEVSSPGSNPVEGGILRNGSPGSFTYVVKPGFANKPVNYVGFYDALRFANWLHNGEGAGDTETGAYTITAQGIESNGIRRNPGAAIALPSDAEWYKAAYYDPVSADYFFYATGSNTNPSCGPPGPGPNRANCGAGSVTLTDVGAYTGSPSPYGTFDQNGNVNEWNERLGFGDPVIKRRVVRGGGVAQDANTAAFPPWIFGELIVHPSSTERGSIGFRVVRLVPVPAPGTSLLLLLGVAGLVLRRSQG